MSSAVLRIFSGLHLGAEIELIEGVYVIGTDDSCDLILHDSSLKARHAALRLTSSGDALSLTAEALDGAVSFNGVKQNEECDIPPLTPFQLGLVTVAWQSASEEDCVAGWTSVENQLLAREMPNTPETGSASAPAPADSATPSQSEPAEDTAFQDALEAFQPDDSTAPSKPKKLRNAALLASALLVGALCFNWSNSTPEPTPAQIMRTLLDEAGYTSLNVVAADKSITVTGRIATDRERGRLLKLAQLLKFPVYLNVTVHSDAADAVRASFNTLGLWPEVTELPPSARPCVRVRGYIRNGFLEEMALSTAKRNVPALRPAEGGGKPAMEIVHDIRHEQDVDAELEPALMAAGLQDIKKIFLPGRIELRGTLTPQSKAALVDVASTVEKKLGVSIPFDIINEAEEQKPQANIYTNHGSLAVQKDDVSSSTTFKVVSVSMGAMKFVTLECGERVFEGGELPGGYLLEHIDVDVLTLSRNGKSTRYPLRGSHE